MDELLTITEAASRLGRGRTTIWGWCQDGYLKAHRRPGRQNEWQIPVSEIDRILAEAEDA